MYRFLLLVLLCIWSVNQTEATCLKYNRKDYRHWIDEDRDCQNTRNEVLIQESLEPVTYKSSKGCKVSSGKWYGSFTGKSFTNSGEGENGENGYKEGLEHGRLTYSVDDGLRYEGGLKDGKYNETFTSSDGLRYESRV